MYAVIETGGKQYRVEVGTELEVELLDAEPGKTITIDRVLLVADGDESTIGRPLVADASVSAEVVSQTRGPKLISFKYRPKARSRVKKGHRQDLTLLRVADTVAVVSITFAYSFLLHVHLHLWANAHGRPLNKSEHLRVYLSYIPTVFLLITVPQLWTGEYEPMFTKLSFFVIPFAFWIAYVLGLIALTELLIARKAKNRSEKRIMQTLAASFIGVGVVIFAALAAGVGAGTVPGLYLKTFANLGSLLPSVLLAYYIYRYRYLEIIIERSLVVVTFATVVLTVYVFGIRTIGDWMTQRYGVRPGLVEALLILALALLAAPLRGWLAQRFHKLFEREAALYKEIVARIGAYAGQYKDLADLLHFVEERTTDALVALADQLLPSAALTLRLPFIRRFVVAMDELIREGLFGSPAAA